MTEEVEKVVINIYPCVDALLYAPIYLAIRSFRYGQVDGIEPRLGKTDGRITHREWNFASGLTINLYFPPDEPGDEANCRRLKEGYKFNTSNELHIGVGDSLTALQQLE